MVPLIVAGVAAGAMALAGSLKSRNANKQMSDLEQNRPIYTTPEQIQQYLEMAKTNANSLMPGTSEAERNIQASVQGGIRNIQNMNDSSAGSIAAVNELYKSEMGAYNNLLMQQAQYHQSQQEQLARAFQESARYSDQEFEYNINSPWQRQYNRAINKYEAGQNMIQSGFNTLSGSMFNYMGAKAGASGNSEYTPQYATSNEQYWGNMANTPMNKLYPK